MNVSEISGTLGSVMQKHQTELSNIRNYSDILQFINNIKSELNKSAVKYLEDEVIPKLSKINFAKAYRLLYNIYLAGFPDTKIGR